MINGNANDFIDKLSYEDHYVMFDRKKYYFNGCQTSKNKFGEIIRVKMEIYDLTNNLTVFSVIKKSVSECLADFQKAKIFNGKSFWDVEKEMEWVDE